MMAREANPLVLDQHSGERHVHLQSRIPKKYVCRMCATRGCDTTHVFCQVQQVFGVFFAGGSVVSSPTHIMRTQRPHVAFGFKVPTLSRVFFVFWRLDSVLLATLSRRRRVLRCNVSGAWSGKGGGECHRIGGGKNH